MRRTAHQIFNLLAIQLCLILLFPKDIFAWDKEYERVISYSELFAEIKKACDDSVDYFLQNTMVELFIDGDDTAFVDVSNKEYGGKLKGLSNLKVRNLTFTSNVYFSDCGFNIPPAFVNCEFKRLTYNRCEFDFILRFDSCSFNEKLVFNHCKSPDKIKISNSTTHFSPEISISSPEKSAGKFGISFNESKIDYVEITDLNFEVSVPDYSKVDYSSSTYLDLYQCEINKLNIARVRFPRNESYTIQDARFYLSVIERLSITETELDILNFDHLTVSKHIWLDSLHIGDFVSVEGFDYVPQNANMAWWYFTGSKLGVGVLRFSANGVYRGRSSEELKNKMYYGELISCYNKLYSMYKTRGDRMSANGCYIEMKDLETRKLKYVFETHQSLDSWFNWKLNQFLKVFCDYGTNPVKSLIISMWIILGFACIYFFTYSDWDKINRSFLVSRYRKMLTYFDSEQRMEDFYSDDHKEEFQSYQEFKEHMVESKQRVPVMFGLLGKPLYHLSLSHHNFIKWLYRRIEPLSGRWVDLKGARKVYVGALVGVSIASYGLYLIFLRAFNSLFLSMNTFTTLGFGEIPVRGIGRYIAILEGFLGWFLLSIFSVSLISQILQN